MFSEIVELQTVNDGPSSQIVSAFQREVSPPSNLARGFRIQDPTDRCIFTLPASTPLSAGLRLHWCTLNVDQTQPTHRNVCDFHKPFRFRPVRLHVHDRHMTLLRSSVLSETRAIGVPTMVEKQLNAINVLHQGSSKAKSLTGFGLATSIDQLACFPFQSCPGQKTTPEFCRKSEKLLISPPLSSTYGSLRPARCIETQLGQC